MVSIILPYYNRLPLLINTMRSFEHFYIDKDVEVIIVDDGSSDEHRLDNYEFKIKTKIIRLENKNGINPCYPYNVGVRHSSGDTLILSSPETFHTKDMFSITNNFSELKNDTYLLFSVFCITQNDMINEVLTEPDFNLVANKMRNSIPKFYSYLGENGYPFNNKFGSWYLHGQIRPSGLNFFTAITREKYYEMSGFDERFRFGTGFDDNEFKDRLLISNTKFIYYDNAVAIHVNHEVVNNSAPTTNQSVYQQSIIDKYKKNSEWGKL